MTAPFHVCTRCRLGIVRAARPLIARQPHASIRQSPTGFPNQWLSIRAYSNKFDNVDEDKAMDQEIVSEEEYKRMRVEGFEKKRERAHQVARAKEKAENISRQSDLKELETKESEIKLLNPRRLVRRQLGRSARFTVGRMVSPQKTRRSEKLYRSPLLRAYYALPPLPDPQYTLSDGLKRPQDSGLLPPDSSNYDFPLEPKERRTIESINSQDIGSKIQVRGWLLSVQAIGKKLAFIKIGHDGREFQATVHNDTPYKDIEYLKSLKPHTPVEIEGVLQYRNENHEGIPHIYLCSELLLSNIKLIGNSPAEPIIPDTVYDPKQRYLTLRTNQKAFGALKLRSEVSFLCRQVLRDEGFTEVETPLLFKSTPEGAREFLVPTRNQNMMYALPQSPQQYKQVLMASGILKYYQFAKCFRDEALRSDRQPEFTQLDLEMGFANGSDVQRLVERLLKRIWWEFHGIELGPFPVLTYRTAMNEYGSDKPDMRYDLKIIDINDIIDSYLPPLQREYVHRFYKYELISVPNMKMHDGTFNTITKKLKEIGNLGEKMTGDQREIYRAHIYNQATRSRFRDNLKAIAPHLSEEILDKVMEDLVNRKLLRINSLVFLAKRKRESNSGGSTLMGDFRKALASVLEQKGYLTIKGHKFAWITRFPLFTKVEPDDTEPGQSSRNGYKSTHHPFTAPLNDHVTTTFLHPLRALGQHYDIVYNGVELGGGSTRIHDALLQRAILEEVLDVPASKLKDFQHLFDMLASGCPPHAGLALGFDRLVAMLMGSNSIRDVIAFPKNNNGVDPMVDSPSLVTPSQLEPYGILMENPPAVEGEDESIYPVEEAEEAKDTKVKPLEEDQGKDAEEDVEDLDEGTEIAPFNVFMSEGNESVLLNAGMGAPLESEADGKRRVLKKWSDLLDVANKQFAPKLKAREKQLLEGSSGTETVQGEENEVSKQEKETVKQEKEGVDNPNQQPNAEDNTAATSKPFAESNHEPSADIVSEPPDSAKGNIEVELKELKERLPEKDVSSKPEKASNEELKEVSQEIANQVSKEESKEDSKVETKGKPREELNEETKEEQKEPQEQL
ncbi:aspartyl-tRNA synthetase 2, mitochondrial [Orbilia ellipsospora]|uniref:Aspartyl-tRNA synthetase 2, mitochondrial n=1 Tax=Orbilia ellipsospora TaxID=2528407 RepID=A0AAV9XAI7_9PEZI